MQGRARTSFTAVLTGVKRGVTKAPSNIIEFNPPSCKQKPLLHVALLGSMLCSCTDTISIFSTNLQHFRPEWLRSKPAVKLPLSWDPRLIPPSLIETWQPVPYHWTFGTAQTLPAGRAAWRQREERVKREALYHHWRGVKIKQLSLKTLKEDHWPNLRCRSAKDKGLKSFSSLWPRCLYIKDV